MCFKNSKQFHINNCLADKLINMVINIKTKNNLQKQVSPSLGQNNASPPWKL